MSDRSGIEIDYCPQCRGVWLDRGELDKIIERSITAPQPHSEPAPSRFTPPGYDEPRYDPPRHDDRDRYGDRGRYDDRGQRPHRRKRENWLSELFD